MQTKEDGETRIVSTASRVLTLAEQRISTYEQELLATVYVVQKFRFFFVLGHKIRLCTDNKSLSYLHTRGSQKVRFRILLSPNNGNELNFISLPPNFKIYIKGEMMLPMILVQNQIRNMLSGETGKITFGRINYSLGLQAKEFHFVYNIGTMCGCGLKGYWY